MISFDIKNLSTSNTNTYTVKRYDMVINLPAPGDTAFPNFCFAGGCYGVSTTLSPNPLVLAPLESASSSTVSNNVLDADLVEAVTLTGYTYVKYTLFNEDNVNDSIQFSIKYNDPVWLGLKAHANNSAGLEVFPNPAKDLITISGQHLKENARLEMLNATGEIIYAMKINAHDGTFLNTRNLPPGVYFVKVTDLASTQTRKLVIE
jgi:hypothetical protein